MAVITAKGPLTLLGNRGYSSELRQVSKRTFLLEVQKVRSSPVTTPSALLNSCKFCILQILFVLYVVGVGR